MPEPAFVVRTREALADPRPGDRFHEMYSAWTVVVAVSSWGVTVLEAGGPFNLVPGRIRNQENEYAREQRIKRREPYQEWVHVDPWHLRAVQHHYPTLAEFQAALRGDLLYDRGTDVSDWPRQRAAASTVSGPDTGKEASDG